MVGYIRDSSGQFETDYDDNIFLQVVGNSSIPLTTNEIADQVGCSRSWAFRRLKRLEKNGEIYSNLSGRSRKWSSGSSPHLEERTLTDYAAANLSKIPDTNAQGMVIAIQQPHSRDILNGKKNIEFRRGNIRKANQPDIAFIYEPSPTQSIVGVFEVDAVEQRPVSELIELGIEETPSTRESLTEYFSGLDEGTAIHVGEAKWVEPPVPLNSDSGGGWRFNPPQSFYYVDPEEFINTFPQANEERPPEDSQQSGVSSKTS